MFTISIFSLFKGGGYVDVNATFITISSIKYKHPLLDFPSQWINSLYLPSSRRRRPLSEEPTRTNPLPLSSPATEGKQGCYYCIGRKTPRGLTPGTRRTALIPPSLDPGLLITGRTCKPFRDSESTLMISTQAHLGGRIESHSGVGLLALKVTGRVLLRRRHGRHPLTFVKHVKGRLIVFDGLLTQTIGHVCKYTSGRDN